MVRAPRSSAFLGSSAWYMTPIWALNTRTGHDPPRNRGERTLTCWLNGVRLSDTRGLPWEKSTSYECFILRRIERTFGKSYGTSSWSGGRAGIGLDTDREPNRIKGGSGTVLPFSCGGRFHEGDRAPLPEPLGIRKRGNARSSVGGADLKGREVIGVCGLRGGAATGFTGRKCLGVVCEDPLRLLENERPLSQQHVH